MFAESGVTVPGVPSIDHGNWRREYNISYRMLCFVRNILEQITHLDVHLAYKNVDRFWNGLVHQ